MVASPAGLHVGVVFTKAERDAEKMAWCQERLVVILIEGETPSSVMAADSADQRRTLAGLVGKTRLSTARKYLRYWDQMRDWLIAVKGNPWPVDASVLVDYLHVLEDGPCCPTKPQAWHQSVCWVFKCGGYEGAENPALQQLVLKTVDRMTVTLGTNLKPILQAARLPCVVLASLQLFVTDERRPVFKRIHAGSLLFRAWATLRFDDQQKIRRNSMRMTAGILNTTLMSSKTSGPGKRMKQLPVAVTDKADLLGNGWLSAWLALLQEHLPLDRDYLLDKPSADYLKTTDKELRYTQSAAMTRVIIAELGVPVLTEGTWTESSFKIMPMELLGFFTEHGPRAVVPSAAVGLEDDKSKRDMVGRWCPSGSDDYARTHRAIVVGIQTKVVEAMKRSSAACPLHEEDVIERAFRFLTERRKLDVITAQSVCNVWRETLDSFSNHLAGVTLENEVENNPLSTFVPHVPVQILPLEQRLRKERAKVTRVGTYMITFNRTRRKACLHKVERGCYWAKTELNDVELYSKVDPSMYDTRCKFCFRKPEGDRESDTSSDSD